MKRLINKYSKLSVLMKASLWFTISNILQKGISMITVPIFTRLLTPEQYGVYSVYQSWYSIVTVFATLNLYYGVFNNGMTKFESAKNQFTSSIQGLVTILTGILFIIYLLFIEFWNQILGLSTLLILVMFLDLFFTPAYSFWAARQRFEFKYKALVFVTLIIAILSPIVGVLSVIMSSHKAEARIISFVLIQVCFGLFFYLFNFYKGKQFYNPQYWTYALKFNIPLIPHYLAQSILNQSDRIMIGNIIGEKEAAIYSVAYSLATLMILVTSAINNSLIPFTYKCLKNQEFSDLRRSVNFLITIVGAGVLVVIAFGPELVQLFAPVEYYEAIWIIPPVATSVYFMFLYPIFGNVEFYFEANKFIMYASIAGAVMNIFLNVLFIDKYGYIAAGYTTLFCYVLFSLGHYVFMNKLVRLKLSLTNIYDMKYIAITSIAIIFVMLMMLFTYKNIYIRYSIVFLIIIAGLTQIERLKKLTMTLKSN